MTGRGRLLGNSFIMGLAFQLYRAYFSSPCWIDVQSSVRGRLKPTITLAGVKSRIDHLAMHLGNGSSVRRAITRSK